MADVGTRNLTAYHHAQWATNNTECGHNAIFASACRGDKTHSLGRTFLVLFVFTCAQLFRPMTVKALLQFTWLKSLTYYQTWDHMPWHTFYSLPTTSVVSHSLHILFPVTLVVSCNLDNLLNFLIFYSAVILLTFWRRNFFFNFSTPCIKCE